MMDLQILCTNICTRNSIDSVLQNANSNSISTTISKNSNYNQFIILLDYSNKLYNIMKDRETEKEERKI